MYTAALALGLFGVVVGGLVELRAVRVQRDDDAARERREERVRQTLASELDGLLDRSLEAARTVASASHGGNVAPLGVVVSARRRAGVDGLAVYDAGGEPEVWDGEHRGRVPDRVRQGGLRYAFEDLPLARHLYVAVPREGGGVVIASTLMQSDLPPEIRTREGDFVQRFEERTGERLSVVRPRRAGEQPAYEMIWRGEPLFAVLLERPPTAERVERLRMGGVRIVWLFVLAVWLLLLSTSSGGAERERALVVSAPVLAALVPPDILPILGADPAFRSPEAGLDLLRLVALLGAGGLLLPVVPRATERDRLPTWSVGVATAIGLPLLLLLLTRPLTSDTLASGEAGWILWAGLLGGTATLLFWLGLATARPRHGGLSGPAIGIGIALLLTALSTGAAVRAVGVPVVLFALWTLPLLLLRGRIPTGGGVAREVAPLLVAGCLGVAATLPWAWGTRIEARMAAAEVELARLGTGVDAGLEELLVSMGEGVQRLDAVGGRPVELLYEAWRNSGLGGAGYPVWLTLWSPGGLPEEDLPVGTAIRSRPGVADARLDEAIEGDTIALRRYDNADAHYVLEVPLRGGWVVTAVVPPLRSLRETSLLGPLLGALGAPTTDPLTLVPVRAGPPLPVDSEVEWVRSASGWRGELTVAYPGETTHAHFDVPVPGVAVTLARAGILLLTGLATLTVLWGLGRTAARGPGWVQPELVGQLRSFRARVTLALFGFFAVSTVGFGTLAYRTIAGASERAAEVLAERVAGDAEAIYFEVQGRIDFLAQRVGSELLGYRDGRLQEGSLDPLVELGLYPGWLPFDLHRELASLEAVQATRRTELGAAAWVTAYRRLPDGDVLAAPVPLQAGATAVRAQEVIHLLAFAILAGAVLSLVLALLAGRALAQPIQTLRVASERVGAGNLRLRLPDDRDDEFGRVFEAFNRMVRRLRRARRSLLRTTQRTRAIVEDSATGVVALDANGRVTLVNPRAEELLGAALTEEIELTAAIERTEEEGARAVLRWIRDYQLKGPLEAAADLQMGGRRIRARGRRITREGPAQGVVVNLEDVTDELRAERVIAWGEMARQVAHEVKNPLTPIKLSIQHIRRAWTDGRPDFQDILTRNADAMLNEIDRLAEIASGFSRFAAPGDGEVAPLEGVDLPRVIDDVLALYTGPEGPVRFEARVDASLPLVKARSTEVKEVLVNLLENARAAVEGQGLVTVHAFRSEVGVTVQVVDDGSGIPEALLGRIFEPQFSTRSTGAGLGLAIVRRLVEGWGGQVAARSRVGEGTSLQIDFTRWLGD